MLFRWPSQDYLPTEVNTTRIRHTGRLGERLTESKHGRHLRYLAGDSFDRGCGYRILRRARSGSARRGLTGSKAARAATLAHNLRSHVG